MEIALIEVDGFVETGAPVRTIMRWHGLGDRGFKRCFDVVQEGVGDA